MLSKNYKRSNRKVIVGIDEAGRGPVVGPMVFGALILDISENTKSPLINELKDSKTLTPARRDLLYNKIKTSFDYAYKIITPQYLNKYMHKKNKNQKSLNEISYDAIIELLKDIGKKYTITKVYLDMIGSTNKYLQALHNSLGDKKIDIVTKKSKKIKIKNFSNIIKNTEYIIKTKADSLYPIVSGASIIAKVNRDILVDNKYGSGYPSDPITINYIKNNIDVIKGVVKENNCDQNIRYEWMTIKKYFVRKNEDRLNGKLNSLNFKP
ncbi:Ribonuclease HII [Spraguea lophii 42_110]|uniref:Ribonuclease n=1 Tax=Spraguea lophii (strain 42_110) TaxID=1358809 RepID=S7XLL8_SPRLO|nr:Ribonuclease HII [Spraguea lophii 42_110]